MRACLPRAYLSVAGALVPLLLAASTQAQVTHAGELEHAAFEDYRVPAGAVMDGALQVTMEARAATWRPWGEDGPALRNHVFALAGSGPKIPGPMIRVTAGTPVRVTLRNTLRDTLLVRGLQSRGQTVRPPRAGQPATGPFVGDSLVIAPGESGEVRFTPTVPGTFFYFGRTYKPSWSARPQPPFGVGPVDRGLVGVLIVDAPGEVPHPDERTFLITHWADPADPGTFLPATRFMINGRAWPHTERLEHVQGDTVRWRIINHSVRVHPMHLHGFYFNIDALGTQVRERRFAPGERALAVTQAMPSNSTMRISWVATEPGNWLFHCHLMRHMSWIQNASFDEHGSHDPGAREGEDLMGGLVLGISVRPDDGYRASADIPRRRLSLHIGKRGNMFGDEPGYGFVLQEGNEAPAADSVRFPGSPIVLTRGEPTEIVVRNSADVPLGVHWHGLELESRGDGVPGWSGMPGSLVPATGPGDSLVVRMTPPRAGTFMYHVHSEPGHQLAQGLYGPFLVLEPGEEWNRETDRVFLLGSLGTGDDPPPAINGEIEPRAIELRSGTAYRFRFMHISPDDEKRVTLLARGQPVQWQAIAKDGADLPSHRRSAVPADLDIAVGETYDFLWTPEQPGELTLRVVTTFDQGVPIFPRPAPPPHTMDVPVIVR